MSKKPPTSPGPRRDQRRGVTIIDAKPVEAKIDAAPTGSPGVTTSAEAKPTDKAMTGATTPAEAVEDAALGKPVETAAAPIDGTPPAEPVAPAAAEAGPLGATVEPTPATAAPSSSGTPVTADASSAGTRDAAPGTEPSPVIAGFGAQPSSAAPSVPSAGQRATKETASSPSPNDPAPAPAARGLGIGSLLAASIFGGLVGAGLMVAYDSVRGSEPSDLPARVAQVEQGLAARPPLEPLEQRLAAVETAQKSAQGAVDGARQAAERAAATAQQALDKPPPATNPASEANAKAIQELQARLGSLDGAVKAAGEADRKLEGRLAEQDKAIQAGIERATEATRRTAQGLQRVAAAERIADALRAGAPYPQALEVLRRSGADAARVEAVAPFAASGAPTPAALAAEFKPVAERIAAASATPPAAREPAGAPQGGGDWTGSLMRLADRIVTVRPSGEAAPDAVKAALDRVEAALRGGDVRGAQQAYEALPAPAKEGSREFGQKLSARVAAEEAARALAGDAVAGLDTSAR